MQPLVRSGAAVTLTLSKVGWRNASTLNPAATVVLLFAAKMLSFSLWRRLRCAAKAWLARSNEVQPLTLPRISIPAALPIVAEIKKVAAKSDRSELRRTGQPSRFSSWVAESPGDRGVALAGLLVGSLGVLLALAGS